jgi:hypothetical protein
MKRLGHVAVAALFSWCLIVPSMENGKTVADHNSSWLILSNRFASWERCDKYEAEQVRYWRNISARGTEGDAFWFEMFSNGECASRCQGTHDGEQPQP